MYRIITNKCFVANRETARSPERLEDQADSLISMQSEPGYEDILDHPEEFLSQCGDEIHIAFKKLSTAERSCLLLKAVQQFSYKEIAAILEVPLGTVMTHLSRARARLRVELLDYGRKEGWLRKPVALRVQRQNEKENSYENAG